MARGAQRDHSYLVALLCLAHRALCAAAILARAALLIVRLFGAAREETEAGTRPRGLAGVELSSRVRASMAIEIRLRSARKSESNWSMFMALIVRDSQHNKHVIDTFSCFRENHSHGHVDCGWSLSGTSINSLRSLKSWDLPKISSPTPLPVLPVAP